MAKKSMVAKQKRKAKQNSQQENIAVAESADVHMHI